MALTDTERGEIASLWVEAVNVGDVGVLDQLVDYDVVDHAGLNDTYGGGCEGHKHLVEQLRSTFPDWSGQVDSVEVDGDLVTVRHSGSASYPQQLVGLIGDTNEADPSGKVDFHLTTCVRVDENGKITEHWALEGPFGRKSEPGSYPGGELPEDDTPEQNKRFMQAFVGNVIDAMNPGRAREYMVPNFYNHDPAPGEQPGVEGSVAFIESIFVAFSDFRTTLEEQLAEDDLVVGRWSQTFVNSGPYLGFPPNHRQIDIGGITITRVRNQQILEQWEARDALSLLGQMGVSVPLGDLEGSDTEDTDVKKELVSHFFYDVWNRGNDSLADELFARDYTNHSQMPGQLPGVAGVKQLVHTFRTAFPDGSVSVDLQVAAGSRVATRYTFRGTHRGTFRGVAPTGKNVSVTGISIHDIVTGRIGAHWGFFDDASLVFQLGLIEFPSAPGGPSGETPEGGSPYAGPSSPSPEAPPMPSPWA